MPTKSFAWQDQLKAYLKTGKIYQKVKKMLKTWRKYNGEMKKRAETTMKSHADLKKKSHDDMKKWAERW